ncbi:hypothetical protein K0U27_02505 [archaeon]|nr:hypothetical protein [archaeon]
MTASKQEFKYFSEMNIWISFTNFIQGTVLDLSFVNDVARTHLSKSSGFVPKVNSAPPITSSSSGDAVLEWVSRTIFIGSVQASANGRCFTSLS